MEEDIICFEEGLCISDGTSIGRITGQVPMVDTYCYNVEIIERVAGLVVMYNDKMLHNTIVRRYMTASNEDWDQARKLDAMDAMKFLAIVNKYHITNNSKQNQQL